MRSPSLLMRMQMELMCGHHLLIILPFLVEKDDDKISGDKYFHPNSILLCCDKNKFHSNRT